MRGNGTKTVANATALVPFLFFICAPGPAIGDRSRAFFLWAGIPPVGNRSSQRAVLVCFRAFLKINLQLAGKSGRRPLYV